MDASNKEPVITKITAEQAFGLQGSKVELVAYDRPWNGPIFFTPEVDPTHVWDLDVLRKMIYFWRSGNRALKLNGYHGAGKSSSIEQFLACLNWPMMRITATPRTEAQQLKTQVVFSANGPQVLLAPAYLCAKLGAALIIEEYNVLDPGEATGLNALLDGYRETVIETGEAITPHPLFRVFGTQNPKYASYQARNAQDPANEDRWDNVTVKYLDEAVEVEVITAEMLRVSAGASTVLDPVDARRLAEPLVKFANMVREQYMSLKADALEVTISTRLLKRMVGYIHEGRGLASRGISPQLHALELVLTGRSDIEPSTKIAIEKIANTVFGPTAAAS